MSCPHEDHRQHPPRATDLENAVNFIGELNSLKSEILKQAHRVAEAHDVTPERGDWVDFNGHITDAVNDLFHRAHEKAREIVANYNEENYRPFRAKRGA